MNRKRIIHYLLITFAITYVFWWGLALLTNLHLVNSSQGIFTFLHGVGGFGPTIAAILVLPDKSLKAVLKFIFSCSKRSFWYLIVFCAIESLIIGLSSMETNPAVSWYVLPIVILFGGGNEELGWRGIMQPELEKRFPFPIATLITGCVWMAWHIPLWFVVGTSQQNINFGLFCIFGLILSFWLATLHRKTNSVFFCALFHAFSNVLISFFVVKVNLILVVGLFAALVFSIWLYYKAPEPASEHT